MMNVKRQIKWLRIITEVSIAIAIGFVTAFVLHDKTIHFWKSDYWTVVLLSIAVSATLGVFVGKNIGEWVEKVLSSYLSGTAIEETQIFRHLPNCASEFIQLVVKKMGYRKQVRSEVRDELVGHFEDSLSDCGEDQKQERASELVAEFGDAKLLATLIRRGKKRCRPMWQKVFVRTLQTTAVIFVVFFLYTAWFVNGKPNVTTDYLAVLKQMLVTQKAIVSQDDNAWADYENAAKILVKPDKDASDLIEGKEGSPYYRQLTDAEITNVKEWLTENEATWNQLVLASKKPHCYFEVEYEPSNTEMALRDVAYDIAEIVRVPLRSVGSWRVRMAMDEGRTGDAIRDIMVMLRIPRQLAENSNVILDHMVGVLICKITLKGVVYIGSTGKLSSTELKDFQHQLSKIYPNGYPKFDPCMDSIRIWMVDEIQHVFTDGGIGGGHLIPGELKRHCEPPYHYNAPERSSAFYAAVSMVHARRDETMAKVNQLHDLYIEDMRKSPYERKISGLRGTELLSSLPRNKYFLLQNSLHMTGRSDNVIQAKTQYEAAITIISLQRWKLDKGVYPNSMDELAREDYLGELPMDPYSDSPLVYKKIDGDFILYSVGENFIDDQGHPGKNEEGKSYIWLDNGDAVFWPAI